MLLNTQEDIDIAEAWAKVAADKDSSILTSIYEDNTNIAIWQRQHQQALETYAKQWCEQRPTHTPRLLLSLNNASQALDELLPELEYKSEFLQDIVLLVDMFACLFDVDEVGLRLTPLSQAMCPKFHVDNIPCRLVTTYGGVGTQWLLEDNVNRNYLGRGGNGLPDHKSGILQGDKAIQQLHSQQVGLLKGSGWEGNENFGLVHRSPALEAEQMRLLLTLDFS